jgi:redox-sensing transcriptional repressor
MMSQDSVQRLSKYRNVLYKLKGLGFVRVFSDNLGDALEISPALVRKDFSQFNLTGNKRGGYQIDGLLEKLNRLLGKDKPHKIVIIGCGKIGQALMNYHGFAREGIRVVAGFDVDPAVINPTAKVPIYDTRELKAFAKREGIKIAILAVPDGAATHVLDLVHACDIKGVLNFAPLQLKGSEKCSIRNINIGMEIENLFYFLRFSGKLGEALAGKTA